MASTSQGRRGLRTRQAIPDAALASTEVPGVDGWVDAGAPADPAASAWAWPTVAYAGEALTASRVGLVVLSSRRTSLEEPSPASPYAILLDVVHDEPSAGELAGTDGFGAEQIADPIWAWSMEWPCSSRLTCAD